MRFADTEPFANEVETYIDPCLILLKLAIDWETLNVHC